LLCLFLDPEYFESINRYQPTPEIASLVEHYCDKTWEITRRGFWTYCTPNGYRHIPQGWKIHISGVPQTALDLIRRIAPILIIDGVPFKFCSDLCMVQLASSKNFPPSGGGKFITIYPRT